VKTEQIWIQSGTARLYSELYIPEVAPAPALLICHGLNAKGAQGLRIYGRLAEAACREGFVCLFFDFRGAGRSSGVFDYGVGEQEDVRCVLDWLASRSDVVSDRLFVVGHSLGGAVSLYALQGDNRVKGLALWSTPKNHSHNVKKWIRRTRGTLGLYAFLVLARIDKLFNVQRIFDLEVYGVKLHPRFVREKLMKLDERQAASKLNVPILIAIGGDDDIVGVDEAQAVYESANEPKTLLVIEGADHVYRGKEQQLINKTLEWIKSISA
jgi:alpha/beta superfamily hydrolase